VSCGGYIDGFHPPLARAVLPISTYVMVTEPLGEKLRDYLREDYAVYDTRFAFDYYRPLPDTRLLWGGRISIREQPRDIAELLRSDLVKVFPALADVRVDYAWGGLMGYSRHKMPHIGQLQPGLWYCQSFGGHGVAPTTAGGEIMAAALAEGDTRYQEFADFGPTSTFGPAGLLGAQLSYWYYELRDWLNA
jgi:glycine/D-amino acid oxidase-like deaminating enzyme